jgi:hypothetical protein
MPEELKTQVKTAEEQAAKTTENKALEDFQWDDGGGDFFGIENTAEVVEVEEKKEVTTEEEDKTKEVKETKEVEDTKEEEDFFGVEVKETEDGVTVEEKEENQEAEDSNRSWANKMKEGGIFQNIEIPEEGEITDDKFIELQDLEIESRVDEAFEGFFTELDTDGAAFLQHKKDGGSTESFFKAYGQNSGAPTGDLDDEHYQEKVSRYYYSNVEKDEAEDIDDKIEWLKDSGKLEKYAQKFDQKIKDTEKTEKENLVKATKEADKTAEEGKKAFVNSVQEALDSTEQVDNFTFTKESKKSLLPFITKSTVKVGKNKYITGMQSKLGTALRDPEKMLILAQLLQNDFDVTNIVANATTVVAKKLKGDLQRTKTSVKPKSSGKTGTRKSLSEFF